MSNTTDAASPLRALTIDELDQVSGGKKATYIIVEKCTETKGPKGTVQTCKVVSEQIL
ncbi:MAG: hypothetical protein M5U07_21905 [Xanthobacteraceae bacterium]|nr:hypothetical protein [Xanthobacteraceae bacterium]